MRFLDIDSPLMQTMTKVANLMILNLLTIVFCIPIITIGPALTALHYMCMKIIRNEDSYIVKGYIKAFKESFKQALLVWLVLLVLLVIFVGDFVIIYFSNAEFHYLFQAALTAMAIMVLLTTTMVFPVMAKFYNTTFQTLKNSLVISIVRFPSTILIVVMNIVPILITIYLFQLFPFVLMFGISAPAFGAAALLNKYFKKLEEQILAIQAERNGTSVVEEEDDGVEKIFSDKLDEALVGKQE